MAYLDNGKFQTQATDQASSKPAYSIGSNLRLNGYGFVYNDHSVRWKDLDQLTVADIAALSGMTERQRQQIAVYFGQYIQDKCTIIYFDSDYNSVVMPHTMALSIFRKIVRSGGCLDTEIPAKFPLLWFYYCPHHITLNKANELKSKGF